MAAPAELPVQPSEALPERWTAVINPVAGRGRTRVQLPTIAEALAAVEADVRIEVSADFDDARRITRGALDDGRGVVACGGDGLVSAIAGLAAERDGLFAIVPAGSGNDLARHLNVPRGDAASAAALLERGVVTRIDLGRAEAADGGCAWFATVANAGFDADANRWANGVESIGGTPLYVLAVLRTLASYRPQLLRVTVDGDRVDTTGWLVAVANSQSYAGGMKIAPEASVVDGALDVCVVGEVSRGDFLRTFPRVFSGTHTTHPAVTIRRGTEVTIEMPEAHDAPELWASGERVGVLPAHLDVTPGAVRVVTSP